MTPGAAGAAPHPLRFPLLADGSLRLDTQPALHPLVERWLPLLPYGDPVPPANPAVITLAAGQVPARPAGTPSLKLGAAEVWTRGDAVTLRCAAGSGGELALATGQARIAPGPHGGEAAATAVAWDVFSACTVAAALLLGRAHRALAHAGAVVAPDGRAWLLVGDAWAGKSTTTVNLITAGWRFVSDDHVVLMRGTAGALAVEGWPRRFHLDEGWESGQPVGRRGAVNPHQRWPGQWERTAPLAGLLFPRVDASRETLLAPLAAGAALSGLLRQSPWLLADAATAPEVLALLSDVCRLPRHTLRLGLDSYRDTERLLGVLGPLTGR